MSEKDYKYTLAHELKREVMESIVPIKESYDLDRNGIIRDKHSYDYIKGYNDAVERDRRETIVFIDKAILEERKRYE